MGRTNLLNPLCHRCNKRNAQASFKGLCYACYKETRPVKVLRAVSQLGEISLLAEAAKTDDDWKKLALQLQPIIIGIADGTIKASAAQAAIVKEILSRAHGRVTKSQEDAKGPSGVVTLPTIGTGKDMMVCPICREEHFKHV